MTTFLKFREAVLAKAMTRSKWLRAKACPSVTKAVRGK